jgi:Fur family ferric uptake transcriptional regulator
MAKIGNKRLGECVMSHYKLNYEDVIRAAGHRVTNQRILILDAVCEGNEHSTVGQIYARTRARDRSIDLSTIYRALKLFVELGLVLSADTGSGELVYEIAKPHHHHHLVCRRCGKEQEVGQEAIQSMFEHVEREYQFRVDTDHLVLFGICSNCQ